MSLVRTSIAGFITAGELIDSITPATVSAEDRGYRRGFSHGYAQAMDDMLLTINRGYSRPREAWNILAAHNDQALLPWRQRKGAADRKSVVSGKSVSVRVDIGGRRIIKKKNKAKTK